MKIFLFDMDGVLLMARGYRRALSETIMIIGQALGYSNAGLTQEDMDVFDSVGVTSEWESSAICSGLMLKELWTLYPDAALPKQPPFLETPKHDLNLPDFQVFFLSPAMSQSPGEPARQRARRALLLDVHNYTEKQAAYLQTLLDEAHHIHSSITHRIFQELVLGNQFFKAYYGLEPSFNAEGYLQTEDIPSLHCEMHEALVKWLDHPDHFVAVFTLRPSKPSGDVFDTPEAEMGLQVVDLEDLPLVGHGSIAWLAEKSRVEAEDLIKPSPVHVLAALRHALGEPLEEALVGSADLVLNGKIDAFWPILDGAEIYAFEDSVTGFQSALSAQRVLSELGIQLDLRLIGISDSRTKQVALEVAGATHVFEDLNQALAEVFKAG
jgi:hypothetical protein